MKKLILASFLTLLFGINQCLAQVEPWDIVFNIVAL